MSAADYVLVFFIGGAFVGAFFLIVRSLNGGE